MKKILLPAFVALIFVSGCVGVVFFVMSLFYDESMLLNFESLTKYASALLSFTVVSGAAAIYLLRNRNKKSVTFIMLCTTVLISLHPLIFINVVKMSVNGRETVSRQVCLEYQLTDVYNAAQRFAESNGGYLPQADGWCDVLMRFDGSLTEDSFKHPKTAGHIIAYNKDVAGMRLDMLKQDTVLFFEAEGGLNLAGSHELIDSLDTETADIILANGRLEKYWVKGKGIKPLNDKIFNALWEVRDE